MSDDIQPRYRRAAYGGASATLRSGDVALQLFKRTTGWGWGELVGADGTLLGVLDHFGELALRDAPVPMRLEAENLDRETDQRFSFAVSSVTTSTALAGSSFERWVGVPFTGPAISGRVVIEVGGDGRFNLSWELESHLDVYAKYLRGPWLRVGAASFGSERDDAILPGIDWAIGREWTSGDDGFRDPWSMRAVPPINSVAIPTMVVSRDSTFIALSWEADTTATSWFSLKTERAQPVFSSPNFIERNDSSLLGLMLPESRSGSGDQWNASIPLELHRGQRISLSAVVKVGRGTALDGVVDWVNTNGMPNPSPERWALDDALHRIAGSYSTGLWHPGVGFGPGQSEGDIRPIVPRFALAYLTRFEHAPEAAALRKCIESLGRQAILPHSSVAPERLRAEAEELLKHQGKDGSFCFDPEGRHRSKDDFVVARDLVAPMGQQGDLALDFDAVPAITLLRAAESTGDPRFRAAGLAALDHARQFTRPEGGDFWETPLHSPNLFAAGHGAVAYALAWRIAGREDDRLTARHWLRSILPFTHLWSPTSHPMLYNTKPCLCSSDWYFANWVRDHVQWEVLETFALAAEIGLDFAAVDPELHWDKFHAGITWAAVRWLLDHHDDSWRPHNLPESIELYRAGALDGCLPDTHNSTTGRYGGMAIPADVVALNLLAIAERN